MNSQTQLLQSLTTTSPYPIRECRRKLGRSIWMWLLLERWSGPPDMRVRSGESIRAGELAQALGVGDRQARRDLQRLRRAGYVELQNTGRGFRIRLTNPTSSELHRP